GFAALAPPGPVGDRVPVGAKFGVDCGVDGFGGGGADGLGDTGMDPVAHRRRTILVGGFAGGGVGVDQGGGGERGQGGRQVGRLADFEAPAQGGPVVVEDV